MTPVVKESYNPDRTALLLEFTEKQANKTSEQANKRIKQANKTSKTLKTESLIRDYLRQNGLSKASEIAKYISLSPARTRVILSNMQGVTYVGTTNNRKYKLEVVGNR